MRAARGLVVLVLMVVIAVTVLVAVDDAVRMRMGVLMLFGHGPRFDDRAARPREQELEFFGRKRDA